MAPLTLITILLLRWFLLTSVLFHQVTHSGRYEKFEIHVSHFSNPDNRIDGECCDGRKNASVCSDGCDTYFVVCLHQPGIPSILQNRSTVFTNGSNFHSTLNATQPDPLNLVSINNIPVWPQPMSVTLGFFDDDRHPGETFKSGNQTSEIIIRHTFHSVISTSRVWSSRNYSENGVAFQYLYRLTCIQDYYGENCDVYCIARDDIYGHSLCLLNGKKVCRPGYTGATCVKAICSPICEHGKCMAPNNCSCDPGWAGAKCQRCITDANCVHGYCLSPGLCSCLDNWTGQNCNTHVNYCSSYNPCKNNAKKCKNDPYRNYTCECADGFEGKNCEKILCPSTCNLTNADCSPEIGCKCHRGWKGPNCNQCTSHPNCTNGYCNKPFECMCLEGWTGTFCNISKESPRPCEDRPCENNGVCSKSSLNGTKQCVCKDGFTGGHCENVLCPRSCNKTRGYCHIKNGCSCYSGWTGPNCNQCIKNSTCANGHCIKPHECICSKGWTGLSCNISDNSICSLTCNKTRGTCLKNNQCSCLPGWEGPNCNQCINNSTCKKDLCCEPIIISMPRKDFPTVAISVTAGILACVIFIFAMFMLWRNSRRRMSFRVTTPQAFDNNGFKQSYACEDVKSIENFNNNFGGLSNLSELQSTAIVMSPVNFSATSKDDQNKNDSGLTLSTDSGFDDGVLPNSCAEN